MKGKKTNRVFCSLLLIFAFFVAANAQELRLERALGALGYQIVSRSAAESAGWEKTDFDMRGKQIFSVKSRKKAPGGENLYYRFAVTVEEYETEAAAEKRLAHIRSTPPGPDSKLVGPEYDLREGFRRGRQVYVVSTAVYTFVADQSLTRFREKLERELGRAKCPNGNAKCGE
jgi:hypothetical protein